MDKETALTNKVTFPYDVSGVTADVKLYAKWKAEEGSATFMVRSAGEWSNAVSAIRSGGNGKSYTITIEGTVSVPPTTGVSQGKPATYTFGDGEKLAVTLAGSGTLSLSGKGFLICLSGKTGAFQKLIIDGPTLQGRSDNTVPLVRLDYATLELKNGKITGNINNGGGGSGSGGGAVIKRGSFTMSGGEISNNTCGQSSYVADGGGVDLSYSSFTMSGGVISGNTGNMGGGVYMGDYDFKMTGGVIKGNTAMSSSPYGGGVYISSYANLIKTGGIIYGSDASDANKNLTMFYDGRVYNNRGAAVFCPIDIVIGNANDRRRESTLGENDHIDSREAAGWGL